MAHHTRFIESEGLRIAASIETRTENAHPVFYPANILFFMAEGQMHVELKNEEIIIPTKSFALIRKYTDCRCYKTWTEETGRAVTYAFMLRDEFIRDAGARANWPQPAAELDPNPVLMMRDNKILRGLFESIITYLEADDDIDMQLVRLKTEEALLGILTYNPEYSDFFYDFARSQRADLATFMQHNYQYNTSLEHLAHMSGRSLSTFNREFRRIFGEAPHRWIMGKRLNRARELLLHTPRRASEIYLELGFEDLAHFSRSFKRAFGKTPTEMKKMAK